MKVLMTGASGLIGTALTAAFVRDGHKVVRLRRPGHSGGAGKNASDVAQDTGSRAIDVAWNPTTCDLVKEPFGDARSIVEGADAAVNLAGAGIAEERWTPERKALLRSSRVHTTRELVKCMEKLSTPPKALISASGVGYYGDRGDEVLTEESKPGGDFLARVCLEWEAEAVKAEALGVRVVRTRLGVILAKNGGALPEMMKPFRFGVGGRLGSGKQWQAWITLSDVVAAIRLAIENSALSGAVNVVAPRAVQNAEFARELGRAMRRPAILPTPAFALRIALGEEMADELLLVSQRVTPARLEGCGYKFAHPELRDALSAVLA